MTCGLCGAAKPLMNSHILPEFLYRGIYDEKHRTLVLSAGGQTRVLQKGLRERLLCDQCEGLIQRYEHYFAGVWFKRWNVPSLRHEETFELTGLDYTRFKLLVLSVVWRAAVSTLPEFNEASLGSHEEAIRRMLLRGDAASEADYTVVTGLLVHPETGLREDIVVMPPARIRVNRHWAIRTVFGGAAWTVFTTSHRTKPYEDLGIREDGSLRLHARSLDQYALESGMAEVAHRARPPALG